MSDTAAELEFSSEVCENELESLSAQLQSPQYFTSLKVTSSKSLKVTRLPSVELKQSVVTHLLSSSSASSASSISLGTAVISESVVSSISLRVDVSYHSVVTAEPWYHRWAEVGDVSIPSTKPIAPDCKHLPTGDPRKVLLYSITLVLDSQ